MTTKKDKKKTSKATKDNPLYMAYEVTTGKWSKVHSPEDIAKIVNPPTGPILCPIDTLFLPSAKIVVVVAESPNWTDYSSRVSVKKTKKLECGRAAAQAAHAVSKLKLSYVLQLSQGKTEQSYAFLGRIMNQPITTIVAKARDTEELLHICKLANEKNLHTVDFLDDNMQFYGSDIHVMTAVAIGPYTGNEFDGITDYLPLWKCGCD